jgi:hypothetical protein
VDAGALGAVVMKLRCPPTLWNADERFRQAYLGQDPARHDTEIADREELKMPATIDDPAILDEITGALKARGIGVQIVNLDPRPRLVHLVKPHRGPRDPRSKTQIISRPARFVRLP